MKKRDSLRFRIIISFTMVGALLGIVYGGIVFSVLHTLEDDISANRMQVEADAFLQTYALNPNSQPPMSHLLKGYVGEAALPEEYRDVLPKWGPGIHDWYLDEYLILIATLPGEQGKFYMIQKTEGIEPLDNLTLIYGTLFGVLVVTVLSSWMGALLGNRIMAPLLQLAREVRQLNPEALPQQLRGNYFQDEVGEVASGLGVSLQRVTELIQREKNFTGDASHELRTPVTVIKGATELVARLSEQGKSIEKPLRRIARAVKDMENIITTFLYLGRQGHHQEASEPFDVGSLVEDLIQQNDYLLEEKDVVVRLIREDVMITAPRAVLAIAIGNLIRNAFQYTDQGEVTVQVTSERIHVTDTGRGMDDLVYKRVSQRQVRGESGEGFGLGLSIVTDFCKRYGWHFEIESKEGEGTRVSLCFGT